ncbi:MAG: hypothetical protein GF330_06455 [Candidatus Eisenbacteria bacterium]|nr:hypothetical protein [Candidatus Eisenbacteria bacterium]
MPRSASTASTAARAEETRRPAGLSEALEDYLEIILQIAARHPVVRVRDIARAKGVRMPTVTAALKRLAALGLVDYQAREHLVLTPAGASIASRIRGRHRFLTRFLGRMLGVSPAVARRDACGLEHHLSAESLERLTAFVEYIETCPEVGGDFLPRFRDCFGRDARQAICTHTACPQYARQASSRGAPRRGSHVLAPVASLRPGVCGEVARIQADERLRVRLQRRGLVAGVEVEVIGAGSLRGAARVRVDGRDVPLAPREARAVFLDTRPAREARDART